MININKQNIENIVMEALKILKGKQHASFDNPISRSMILPLSEGLIKTYPLGSTIRYIKDYFKLSDDEIYPINAENGREQIAIKVPIVDDNLERVEKAFTLCGYYLGFPKKEALKPNTIYELQFEKKYDDVFSKQLRQHESILYHVSPTYYAEKIKHIGLTPRSRNGVFDYPDRTYFIIGSAKKIIPHVVSELDVSLTNKMNNGKYCVMTLDLKRIPENIKFYLGPNSKYSVYTYENIAPNVIVNTEEI